MSHQSRPGEERSGITSSDATSEPILAVGPRSVPFFLRRRFLRLFTPVASVAIVGLVVLLVSGNLLLPFERLVTLSGAGGSKSEFLNDEQVRERLLQHHVRVEMTRLGSRGAANTDLTSLDFVLPSGQPAADLIADRRRPRYALQHRLFVSPIVLLTYREYAETLNDAGVATPQKSPGFDLPHFYDLDMGGFLELVGAGKSWNELNIGEHGFTNSNRIFAQTSDVCVSNSATTYFGMVSYVINGKVPTTDQEAVDFANKTKALLGPGLPLNAPEEIYFLPEGREIAPIIVRYEHEYLAHQLDHRARHGELDHDRVMLYPDTVFHTEPTLVALNEDAGRLGELLATDTDLRRRALELGFRVPDSGSNASGKQLSEFLAERKVPVPSMDASDTRAVLPDVARLEKMIETAGDCQPDGIE